MKSQAKALVVGSLTAFVGISPATVFATGTGSTCYVVRGASEEATFIVRYIAKNEGSLNTDAETREFGHLKQQAYSVVGKGTALEQENCPGVDCDQDRIMTTVDGTIITGKYVNGVNGSPPDAPGAHMGLDVQFLRFDDEQQLVIGPITLECSSTEAKTTPDSWFCNLKAEFQPPFAFLVFGLPLPIKLEKVNPLYEQACSVFQDGGGELPIIPPNHAG